MRLSTLSSIGGLKMAWVAAREASGHGHEVAAVAGSDEDVSTRGYRAAASALACDAHPALQALRSGKPEICNDAPALLAADDGLSAPACRSIASERRARFQTLTRNFNSNGDHYVDDN